MGVWDLVHSPVRWKEDSTEQVFALCYLLGITFMPRLADLGDVQLYRLDRARSHGALDPLLRTVDAAVIVEQWDHIVRIAASIRDRSSPAHVVVDRLAANASDRPAKALTMLGRVVRTASSCATCMKRSYAIASNCSSTAAKAGMR